VSDCGSPQLTFDGEIDRGFSPVSPQPDPLVANIDTAFRLPGIYAGSAVRADRSPPVMTEP